MGGLNSGRRPEIWDPRPQVEDALLLDIPLLRSYDALTSGAHGVMQWTEKRGCIAFHTHGDMITFDYAIRGRAYQQSIQFAAIPLHWSHSTARPCLFCSACQRRGYKLYLSRRPYFLCRGCQGLVYEAQTLHFGGLCYAYLRSLKEERRFEAWWKRRKNKKRRGTEP
jgi:hypothetical protein